MVIKVTTQVIDNRQDPFPRTAEFVYSKFKWRDTYYVLGTDELPANAMARVQCELNKVNMVDNPAYLEYVTDWELVPGTPLQSWLKPAREAGRVFTIEGAADEAVSGPEGAADPVDQLMTNIYGTTGFITSA
jgi:hypothetical protein